MGMNNYFQTQNSESNACHLRFGEDILRWHFRLRLEMLPSPVGFRFRIGLKPTIREQRQINSFVTVSYRLILLWFFSHFVDFVKWQMHVFYKYVHSFCFVRVGFRLTL